MDVLTKRLPLLFLSIFAIFLLINTAKAFYLQKTVYGDGIFYYSWLRSIVIDRDINFTNEYAHFGVTQLPTNQGLIGNQFAIGPMLFWSPVYLSMHSIIQGDGYSFIYQLIISIVSLGFVSVGLLLLYRALSLLFENSIALLTTIGIAFASNIFFYGAIDTVNSHPLSFLLSTVLLNILLSPKNRMWIIGIVCGLLAITRIQDAAFIVIPLLLLLREYGFFTRKYIRSIIPLLLAFTITLLIQFFFWYLLYGDIRIPYLERGLGFNFFQSAFLQVLFSPNSGLFLWTPITILAVIGLLLRPYHKYSFLNRLSFLFFLWQTFLIGSWSIWWQGASFSGRMFISLLPFLSVGLAGSLHVISKRYSMLFSSMLIVFLSLVTFILSIYYLWLT